MKLPSCSLIISTYNWVEALELVLLSVKKQSITPNEVLIADDGSTKETEKLIKKFQKDFPTKLIHVWHEDIGFRKTIIFNKAICKSSSEYIIQIDGDIILHKHFIKNHIKNAEHNFFIEGSRVWLNKEKTKKAQTKKQIRFSWWALGIKNRLNAIYLPILTTLLKKASNHIFYAVDTRGCNMSFWRKDIMNVNGYNEDLEGWGREDSELSVRFINKGLYKKRIKFGAIQYHQHHKQNLRDRLEKNDEILQQSINNKIIKCKNGISKYC